MFAQRAEPCRYSLARAEFTEIILATSSPIRPTPATLMPTLPACISASGYWPRHLAAQPTMAHGG